MGAIVTAIPGPILSLDETAPAKPICTSGAILSFALSLVTFGLLPLWIWGQRWMRFSSAQRRDLTQMAIWYRQRVPPAHATRIDLAVNQFRWGSSLAVIPILVFAGVGSLIGWLFFQGFSVQQIVDMTYRDRMIYFWWNGANVALEPRAIWMVALLLGYACQWMAVRSHTMAVDSLAAAIGGSPLPAVTRSGLNFVWIAAAIGFCCIHAWWGIPLVLAGAMQRWYVRFGGPRMRSALAEQVRRSAGGPMKICRTYRCGARLAPEASFCPRCGTPVRGEA